MCGRNPYAESSHSPVSNGNALSAGNNSDATQFILGSLDLCSLKSLVSEVDRDIVTFNLNDTVIICVDQWPRRKYESARTCDANVVICHNNLRNFHSCGSNLRRILRHIVSAEGSRNHMNLRAKGKNSQMTKDHFSIISLRLRKPSCSSGRQSWSWSSSSLRRCIPWRL